MKKYLTGWLVMLSACGGDPFAITTITDPHDDGAADALDDDTGTDASGESSTQDATDALGDDASSGDGYDGCTAFDAGWIYTCEAGGQTPIYAPKYVCSNLTPAPLGTPSACQCVETYNCACLQANAACAPRNRTWDGCSKDGDRITVTCQ